MNSVMEASRTWSPWLLEKVLWPMLWESSLLIGVLLLLEFGLRRKLRPAIRYALWLAVLVKLILPPSLALPTGVAWWLRPNAPATTPRTTTYTVRSSTAMQPGLTADATAPLAPAAAPPLPLSTWAICGSALVSAALLACMLLRWRQVARMARGTTPAPHWLDDLLEETRISAGLRSPVRLKLISEPLSPAVSGFFRPVILLPRALAERLSAARLRAVLLHELIHLRRRDVWVNCVQALLQIAYWWHPLLWLANARIRRLREEAVDDAVMLALQEHSAEYAPTLLEVARLALQRPLLSLGLVGILESKTALRRRIERLMEFQTPQKAGLTLVSFLGVGLFAAMAVPMGQAPAVFQAPGAAANNNAWPDPRFQGYAQVTLEAEFFVVDTASLRVTMPSLPDNQTPLLISSNEAGGLEQKLQQAHAQPAAGAPLSFAKFSGGVFRWLVGAASNTGVNYQARDVAGQMIVTGAELGVPANGSDWAPLFFEVVPWTEGDNLRCDLRISSNGNTNSLQQTEVVLPEDSALVWATPTGPFTGKSELVVLRRQPLRGASQPLPIDLAALAAANPPGLAGVTNGEPPATAVLDRLAEARQRVQDGKLLFEMGKLDAAEVSLKRALALNPRSQAARYYLNLIQAKRNEAERGHAAPWSAQGPVITNALNSATPSSEGSRPQLYTRIIKVDPETFQQALQSVGEIEFEAGSGAPVQTNAIPSQRLRQFFKTLGVELNPPKAVFFNDREGSLLVRASLQDLDIIERALAVLGISSKGTKSERPIQTKTNVAAALSSETQKVPVLGDIPIVSRLIQSNSPPAQTALPPQINITAKFFTVPAELMPQLELETLLNPANLSGQPNAILSAPKASAIRQALQSHPDIQLIAQTSVTTLSGRQTEVSVEPDLQSAEAATPPPISFGVPQEPSGITNQPPISVQLDIVPDTSAGQPTIHISGKASVKEFLGYATPDTFSPPGSDTRLTKADAIVVSPSPQLVARFQVRKFAFSAVVWDGQTMLLRGVVGDAGTPTGTWGSRNPPKTLLIFITPTLIDSAGNRIQK
jgi:beta-lactamase regulating signal transducer with metallopeptidase domain